MTAELKVAKLQGFSATATSGQYKGCQIEVEVINSEFTLFTIQGTPMGSNRSVAWEASATDYEGVIEWLKDFGLLYQAKQYASCS